MIVNDIKLVNKFKVLQAAAAKESRASVAVGYTDKQALWLHEMGGPNSSRRPVNLGKKKRRPSGLGFFWGPSSFGPGFLLIPARQSADRVASVVTRAYASGAGLLESLFVGGLLIQRESQKRVPVEHGLLRGSGFTEKGK